MKWLGKKLLSSLMAVESRRLVWSAGRMLRSMDKVPGDELQSWMVARQQKIDRLLDDLLELTSYAPLFAGSALYLMPSSHSADYASNIQETSVSHGIQLRQCFIRCGGIKTEVYWFLCIKTSPL
jgi:hypothetical protein